MIIKPLSSEISFTAANTVNDSYLVRVYASADSVVTIANGGGTIGTFTMPAGSIEFVEKNKTDTVAGTTTLLCTPVSYKS